MIFDDLQDRYGSYLAEMVRQVLTLQEFADLEIENVLPYLENRADRLFQEYHIAGDSVPNGHPVRADFRDILKRRWQDADDLVQQIARAESIAREGDYQSAVGA